MKDQEISELKAQVEANPLLAERHAKVVQLESLLKKSAPSPLQNSLDSILNYLETAIKTTDSHRDEIAMLEFEVVQKQDQGKGDDLLNNQSMDVDQEGLD